MASLPWLLTAAAVALLAGGYLIGRVRPIHRAQCWAWWGVHFGRCTTWHALVYVALHPGAVYRAWRNRNAPRPRLAPVPKIRGIDDEEDPRD